MGDPSHPGNVEHVDRPAFPVLLPDGPTRWAGALVDVHGRIVVPGERLPILPTARRGAGVEVALRAALPSARVVLGGIPNGDRTSFPASLARRKGLTLVLVRRMNDAYPRAIRLVERRMIDVSSIVTHRYRLDRVAEAFAVATRRERCELLGVECI